MNMQQARKIVAAYTASVLWQENLFSRALETVSMDDAIRIGKAKGELEEWLLNRAGTARMFPTLEQIIKEFAP